MSWYAISAIYPLFWVLSAFLVMPIGLRTPDEAGVEKVPGQAESAPVNFQPKLILMRATVLSLVIFGLYYANYVNGWFTSDAINIFGIRAG